MKAIKLVTLPLLIAAAFLGGYVYKATRNGGSAAAEKSGRKILYWVDPMHPAYKSDKPGIAPDCGMELEPVYADGGSTSPAASGVPGPGGSGAPDLPPGTVHVTPEKQQLIGVKYGEAEMTRGSRTIRAVGKVTIDEKRIQHVHTKVEGWIDKLFVDFTGEQVKWGDPLLTIYSPEMLASEQELLLAAKAKDLMRNSILPAAFDQSESLLQAARRRLQLWDLSDAQIDQILKAGQPIKNITLYSPASGYVTERKAYPQLKVTPETELYTIVDLSRVWIMADVFEYEAPNIHVGGRAQVSLQSLPGKTFNAVIDYIQPDVDPTTRTLKVRMDMDNPGLMLKPDMYANVEFKIDLPLELTVPTDAVLNAGERKTVFVDRGNGFFEPRQVTTGEREGDRIQILSGLRAGERVVTSGNFLIDSESRLKAAAAEMGGMPGMPDMRREPAAPQKPAATQRPQAGKNGAKGMAGMPGMETK